MSWFDITNFDVLSFSVWHLGFWCLWMSLPYFQDANGPSAESILSFSDLTIALVLPVSFLVLVSIFILLQNLPSYRNFIDHQALEFLWTLTPAISLLLLALPSLSLLYLLDEVGYPSSTSKVIGHQWYWSYESSDLSIVSFDSYLSHSPIRLLGTDALLSTYSSLVLRFLISSADVLHSFAVPALGLKADAVPGRLNSLSTYLERPGVFYGQCSEICGANHSFIPIGLQVFVHPNGASFS